MSPALAAVRSPSVCWVPAWRCRGSTASISYNGLLLNYRDWIDTYVFRGIDGLDDAEVRNSANANPGDHGETPGNAYYSGRTITISGEIRYVHYPKMLDMREALRGAFADIQNERPLWIRHPTGDITLDRIVYCRKQGKLEMPTQSQRAQTFQITLRASNPRIMSHELHSVSIPAGDDWRIINVGNIYAQPRIRFYGPAPWCARWATSSRRWPSPTCRLVATSRSIPRGATSESSTRMATTPTRS